MDRENSLQPEEIRRRFSGRWLGNRIHSYREVDSTNLVAIELAQQGVPEGTIVLADQQLSGRGRYGRSWHSPPGVGVYCSIVLRPRILPPKVQLITLMTAVAVSRAVSSKTGLSPQIKWPNDILVNDKKVGGILLESKAGSMRMEYAVIGIGINVNNTSANVPGELQLGASSLLMELGEPVDRAALVAQLFAELESLYERLQQKDSACILEYWRSFSATLGRPVRVIQRESLIKGIAIDVTEEGALLVRVEDESLVAVHAGEVEHLRIA